MMPFRETSERLNRNKDYYFFSFLKGILTLLLLVMHLHVCFSLSSPSNLDSNKSARLINLIWQCLCEMLHSLLHSLLHYLVCNSPFRKHDLKYIRRNQSWKANNIVCCTDRDLITSKSVHSYAHRFAHNCMIAQKLHFVLQQYDLKVVLNTKFMSLKNSEEGDVAKL